jgi:heme A synthase
LLSPTLFRRLAFTTALFAYLQIALGGVVRVTGSGLGCPDWPLCHGRPYPPANVNSIIEYSHRLVGSITELLIVVTVVAAWIVFRSQRPLVAWLATASLAAGLGEAVLGGIVVANELAPWMVLFHLALAMLILGFLTATAVMSLPASPGVIGFRRTAVIGAAATYVLLLTGSTVVASNADASCHSWPLCGAGFAPDFSGVNAFTMLHRGSVLLVGILIVYVAVGALRQPGLRRAGIGTLAVFALQVAVGASAAITDGPLFNGLHVAIATLVWVGMLLIALLTFTRTDARPALSHLAVDKRPA